MITALRFAKIAAMISVATAGSLGAFEGAATSAASNGFTVAARPSVPGPGHVLAPPISLSHARGAGAPANPLNRLQAALPALGTPHSRSATRLSSPLRPASHQLLRRAVEYVTSHHARYAGAGSFRSVLRRAPSREMIPASAMRRLRAENRAGLVGVAVDAVGPRHCSGGLGPVAILSPPAKSSSRVAARAAWESPGRRQPEFRNQKPGTKNQKPETRNQKPPLARTEQLRCLSSPALPHAVGIRRDADTPENLVVTDAGDTITTLSSCPASAAPGYTLRCAILQADQDCATEEGPSKGVTPVCDTITFDIPQGTTGCASPATIQGRSVFVCTISIGPNGSLPFTANNTTIDGYGSVNGNPVPGTPSGCSGACGAAANTNAIQGGSGDNAVLAIRIDGVGAPVGTNGIQLSGSYVTIRGLDITNFPVDSSATYPATGGDGIEITGGPPPGPAFAVGSASETSNTVTLGFAAQPSVPGFGIVIVSGMQPDGYNGTYFYNSSSTSSLTYTDPNADLGSPTTLGSAQLQAATGAFHDAVAGNFIGLFQTPSGVSAAGNGGVGVDVAKESLQGQGVETIGGTAAADANVISANGQGGGSGATGGIQFAASFFSSVAGNLIGTDPSGAVSMGNQDGVVMVGMQIDSSNFATSNITVGGTAAGAGNVISGNTDDGVLDEAQFQDLVEGDYVGTDVTGTVRVPNQNDGVVCNPCDLNTTTTHNSITIGGTSAGAGNLISGNGLYGVLAASGTIQGNLIGADVTGTKPLANLYVGVKVDVAATVGGTATGAGNVISGNCAGTFSSGANACTFDGFGALTLTGGGVGATIPGNTVQGNFIGTDITGEVGIGNGGAGGIVGAAPTFVFGTPEEGETIGPGNVISFNDGPGIVTGCMNDSVIQGNKIGVDAAGAKGLANGTLTQEGDGIFGNCVTSPVGQPQTVSDSANLTIGGTAPGDGNIIAGNFGVGILLLGGQNYTIEGNSIGTDATGTLALGNFDGGVLVDTFERSEPVVSGILVGGTGVGAANTIAFNDLLFGGVAVGLSVGIDLASVAVEPNAMYGNSGEITLESDNSLASCTGGPVNGVANEALPCPVMTGEVTGSGQVTEIDGAACTGCLVQVFSAANGLYDNLQGGSQVYLGAVTASGSSCTPSPCSSGISSWSLPSSSFVNGVTLVPDQPVTATATRPMPGSAGGTDCSVTPASCETSEFAQDFATVTSADTAVEKTGESSWALPCDNGAGAFIGTGNMDLRCAISEANLFDNQTVTFNTNASGNNCSPVTIQGSSYAVCTISPTNDLPPLLAGGETVDGYAGSHNSAQPNTNPYGQPDNAIITVRVDGAGAGNFADGLSVFGTNDTIEGLSLTGWSETGILVDTSPGSRIGGNFLGIQSDGSTAGHNADGIEADGNTSATSGCTATGTPAPYCTVIGGANPADRNVISGNDNDGVFLQGDWYDLEGNYIGPNATGAGSPGTAQWGVELSGAAHDNIGDGSGLGNVISGNGKTGDANSGIGVDIHNGSTNNTVTDDLIGVNAADSSTLPNTNTGIFVSNTLLGTTGNTIGPGNVIAGNEGNGVELSGGGSAGGDNNSVVGNNIGITPSFGALGNSGVGVYAHEATNTGGTETYPTGDTIGGVSTTNENRIAYNGLSGIQIGSASNDQVNVAVLGNDVYSNLANAPITPGQAGEIYLYGQDPLTCSTATSASGQPDDGLPCPLILPPAGSSVTVDTCGGCTVLLYSFRSGLNDENAGGGLQLLGTMTDTHTACSPSSGCSDTQGSVTFTGLSSTSSLTATAYSADPASSEFAQDIGMPTVSPVAGFSADRHGAWVTFRWRLVDLSGVAGFDLYAGDRQLNHRLIAAHSAPLYTYTTRLSRRHAHFTLRIVFRDGRTIVMRSH